MSVQDERVRAVDTLRGIAMLGVIAIHARPTIEWTLHDPLVGRSVPVFLVLVGVTAELWRRRQPLDGFRPLAKAYLSATARRLLVPYWAWLLLMLVAAAAAGRLPESLALWLLSPLGYVPWAGPTWFITAIVLLSFAIPFLHWCAARLGPGLLCALGLATTVLSHLNAFELMGVARDLLPLPKSASPFFYFWIFVPSYFWHVTAGMWLARHGARVHSSVFSVAVLALIWGHWALAGELGPQVRNAVAAVMDVPLTIVLLGIARGVARAPAVGAGLAYVGRASWGMYLGHALVFATNEFFKRLYQFDPDATVRWLYFLSLLAAGLVLTFAGRWVRNRAAMRYPLLAPRA